MIRTLNHHRFGNTIFKRNNFDWKKIRNNFDCVQFCFICRNVARPNSQFELATRLIALASVGNAAKSKFIYALNATAVDKMRLTDLIQKTTNEIPCPYDSMQFTAPGLKTASNANGNQQYFYDMNASGDQMHKKRGKFNQDHSGQHKKPRLPNFDQGTMISIYFPSVKLIPCAKTFRLAIFFSLRKMLVLLIFAIGGKAFGNYNW